MTEYMNQYEAALHFYSTHTPIIMETPRNEWAGDPYAWDRWISMTPIEAWLWGDIRDANAVFYPQYPVGRFFVDFANPRAKVAIECDGKAYHQDVQKDMARQEQIEEMGWRVYRISGRQCMTDFDDETREYGYARLFIEKIARRHGLKRVNSAAVSPFMDHQIKLIEHLLKMNPEVSA
jgi:very-short-patch-repair endonuclease